MHRSTALYVRQLNRRNLAAKYYLNSTVAAAYGTYYTPGVWSTAVHLVCTVEALLSHTPPSHEKCMGYEGLWEDRERLHARLAGIPVPNVMKGINGQSKGIGKSLGMT